MPGKRWNTTPKPVTREERSAKLIEAAARWHHIARMNETRGEYQLARDERRVERRLMVVVAILRSQDFRAIITDAFIGKAAGLSASEFVHAVEVALDGLPGKDTETPAKVKAREARR